MASSVTTPLERQFGQLPGLQQMTSTSSFGASLITLQFTLEYQHRRGRAAGPGRHQRGRRPSCPAICRAPPIYSKVNPADTPILTLALTSDTLPLTKVEDLADTNLAQKISQLPGVGLVSISGGQRPAIRVQADPTALASYGLGLEDLRAVLGQANVDQAKGSLEGPRQSFSIGANDQLFSTAEYKRPRRRLHATARPCASSDVADVIDGAENVKQAAWMNDKPAVIVNIQRQPGANIIGVVDRIKRLLPQLRASLPVLRRDHDRSPIGRPPSAPPWRTSQFTLMLTIGARRHGHVPVPAQPRRHRHPERRRAHLASWAPSASCTCSATASNNLSLMALTISTGFVVDDAIVMIENIARYIEAGESPLEAALKGSEQIGFTIVSLTVSLIAVLIPLLFMGDIVGRLFREFAVTLSVAILVSAVVSLTLTPDDVRQAPAARSRGPSARASTG